MQESWQSSVQCMRLTNHKPVWLFFLPRTWLWPACCQLLSSPTCNPASVQSAPFSKYCNMNKIVLKQAWEQKHAFSFVSPNLSGPSPCDLTLELHAKAERIAGTMCTQHQTLWDDQSPVLRLHVSQMILQFHVATFCFRFDSSDSIFLLCLSSCKFLLQQLFQSCHLGFVSCYLRKRETKVDISAQFNGIRFHQAAKPTWIFWVFHTRKLFLDAHCHKKSCTQISWTDSSCFCTFSVTRQTELKQDALVRQAGTSCRKRSSVEDEATDVWKRQKTKLSFPQHTMAITLSCTRIIFLPQKLSPRTFFEKPMEPLK